MQNHLKITRQRYKKISKIPTELNRKMKMLKNLDFLRGDRNNLGAATSK